VTRQDGQRRIVVRRRIGSLAAIVASEAIGVGPVILTIRADRQSYTFGFSLDHAEPHLLTTGETRYLSTEVAGGFTGVYFAMYATGNGQVSKTPAFFNWFDYRMLE
jgi:alpha-N-arabinofuranosidase